MENESVVVRAEEPKAKVWDRWEADCGHQQNQGREEVQGVERRVVGWDMEAFFLSLIYTAQIA
jgi:hypothetical protein